MGLPAAMCRAIVEAALSEQQDHSFNRRVKQDVAAPYVCLSEATLEADRANGKLGIPFFRVGRAVIYDLDELDAWLAARRYHGVHAQHADGGGAVENERPDRKSRATRQTGVAATNRSTSRSGGLP